MKNTTLTPAQAVLELRQVIDGPNGSSWQHTPAVTVVLARLKELESKQARAARAREVRQAETPEEGAARREKNRIRMRKARAEQRAKS